MTWQIICGLIWPLVIMGIIHNIMVERKLGRREDDEREDDWDE
jgi:hypothetical protein